MSFKRNWGFIWQEELIIGLFGVVGIAVCAYFVSHGFYHIAVIAFVGIVALIALGIYTMRLPGHLSDEIHINSEGIYLISRNENAVGIEWENLKSLIKTRKHGTNALAAVAKDDTLVWFYTNGEIESAIIKCYPKAKELIVKDNQFSLYGK